MDPIAEQAVDPLVERITATWRSVLGLTEVGLHTNFFDLGGNSFQLLTVKDRLDTELGVSTDLVGFFRYPTVAEAAEHIYGKTG